MTEGTTDSTTERPLHALFINGTLKPSPTLSHTEGLMSVARAVLESGGVEVQTIRAVDHELAPGVQPDMTEHGAARDDWPAIWERVRVADIVVLGTPIWLGEPSSVIRRVIERLYAMSGMTNENGRCVYYGKVAGTIVTGNEDGVKHSAMSLLYALQHLGFVIPPQADAGWIGEAGPGPSYLDPGSGGPENDFTQRNVTFMSWNLIHLATLLRASGGIPAHGNQRRASDDGRLVGHPNPEYR